MQKSNNAEMFSSTSSNEIISLFTVKLFVRKKMKITLKLSRFSKTCITENFEAAALYGHELREESLLFFRETKKKSFSALRVYEISFGEILRTP